MISFLKNRKIFSSKPIKTK